MPTQIGSLSRSIRMIYPCSDLVTAFDTFLETFGAPSLISSGFTGFTSFANASMLPSSDYLSSSCVQAASDVNVYTTETYKFNVGTEMMTNINTDIVSWGTYLPPEECCQPDLCEITAERVGIIYWPPNLAGTNQSSAQSEDSVQTVVSDGFTLYV